MGRTRAAALGLALVAVLVGAGLGAGPTRDRPLPVAGATTLTPTTPVEPLFPVYVSGWVANPGVVEVGEGSIVAEAVEAAGGALEGAMLEAINLARPLVSGDHVQIPGPGDSVAVAPGTDVGGLISPNRADVSQLEELPGVGPVLAERIIAHREANGPFKTIEDLLDVPGIGEAKLSAIRDLIVVP
ncbi:MAG TPA: ComEA family DNA-binding protein [Acidimicrobiia bacterium]